MSNREDNEGRKIKIFGAHANLLADLMYDDIKKTYGFSDELMCGSWQGTSCDGQYQAKEFGKQLRRRLEHKKIFWTSFGILLIWWTSP